MREPGWWIVTLDSAGDTETWLQTEDLTYVPKEWDGQWVEILRHDDLVIYEWEGEFDEDEIVLTIYVKKT